MQDASDSKTAVVTLVTKNECTFTESKNNSVPLVANWKSVRKPDDNYDARCFPTVVNASRGDDAVY